MMLLNKANEVDSIGIDNETDHVILSIIDDLDWKDEEKHLISLQEKINNYLSFIESGEIYNIYPDAAEKNIDITVYVKHSVAGKGFEFLNHAAKIIANAGFCLRCLEWFSYDDGTEEWKVIL